MDRFGIFVDAGYLHAGAAELCFGFTGRHRYTLDAKELAGALAELGKTHSGFEHLRTYWYDGARDAQPTADHIEIANLPAVKLRLGRLTTNGQKGVDSRIVRDLIILSQARALGTAYLLGGDEDLREGVAEAQERGLRVVLMSIESSGVSATLRMEADDLVTLDKAFLKPHLTLVDANESLAGGHAAAAREGVTTESDARAIGVEYGTSWWNKASDDVRDEVRRGRPRIPLDVDAALLRAAAAAIGGGEISTPFRHELRAGYWEAIDTLVAMASDSADPE